MKLSCPDFADGGRIPDRFCGDGPSPQLVFSEAPPQTAELALSCLDVDAAGWTHWLVRGLPGDCAGLPEAIPRGQFACGGRQGLNGWGTLGWAGPFPPKGPAHRYVFTLAAKDRRGKTIAEASLTGTYSR